MQPKSIVAQRIQELRKEQKITQKSLCGATGIAINTIIGYENSMREPQAGICQVGTVFQRVRPVSYGPDR